MSKAYFEVTVKMQVVSDKGRKKKLTKKILVEAGSFGEAEKAVESAHPDYEITAMKRAKVHEVLHASAAPTGLCSTEQVGLMMSEREAAAPLEIPLTRAQRRALERKSRKAERKAAWGRLMAHPSPLH